MVPASTGFMRRMKYDIIIRAKMEPSKLLEGHASSSQGNMEVKSARGQLLPKPFVCNTNGDAMGRNSISAFVCNTGSWGPMGRKRVSPLEMGIEGGGRVSSDLKVQRG